MRRFFILPALLFLAACAGGQSDQTLLAKASYDQLPGWRSDHHAAALRVFADACRKELAQMNAYETSDGEAIGTRPLWGRVCNDAIQLAPRAGDNEAQQYFERDFTPYRVSTAREPMGHVTGYYEPLLRGSRKKHGAYQTPVYGMPPDLRPGEYYYTRAEIDAGAIAGKAPVLLYVNDPVMFFFLQVQGSGQVALDDGSRVSLHYAGRNNAPYRPIGAILKSRGMDQVNMGNIRDWLHAHPLEAQEIMEQNPCYIFFALGKAEETARGALGLPLVAGRSAAVDAARASYGVPIFVAVTTQDPGTKSTEPLARLLVSEDTGSALSGPHRIDVFFGQGADAEWQAGHQNARGDIFWLLPNP